jgi:hypothetical protein
MNLRFIRFYLIGFTLLVFLPLFQQSFHPFKLAGLQGAFDPGKVPPLKPFRWFSGKFQQSADHYLKYNTAFNGELVRLRNQVDYSLFGNINTNLVLGKENYLFDPNYVDAIEGTNLISDSAIGAKARVAGQTAALLHSMQIPLLVCFAPNKAAYYEEYLKQRPVRGQRTNRSVYDSLLHTLQIPVIDFNQWFLSLKSGSPYPLVPKYGAHWSTYGAALAADSLVKKISFMLNREVVPFRITNTQISSHARFTDDDYLASLNLMQKWSSPPLAYPVLEFGTGERPDVLIISDSFIWNWYDLEVVQHCFAPQSVTTYYFKTLYDSGKNNLGPLPELKKQHLAGRDLIILLTSEPGLTDFGYGFFETVSRLHADE